MSRIIKNYIYNLSYQILVMVLPIVTTPYISRVLKPEGIGAYNYTFSIVSFIVMIAQLGTSLYGQREIAYVQNNPQKRSVVFGEIFIIRLIATVVIVPIYGIIIIVSKEYRNLLLCMSIYILVNAFDISWFYQGLEDFKRTATRNIGIKLIGILLIFVFVHHEQDLIKYTLILALAQFFGNLSLWVGLRKKVLLDFSMKLHLKARIKPIMTLFLPTIAMYVYVYVDKIILGLISDNKQVGYYSQAEKIVKLLLTVITSLGAVLLPHISNSVYKGYIDKVNDEVKKAISYVMHIGLPMTIGAIIISPRFIPIFLGNDYIECINLFSLLSVLIIIIGLASVVGQAVLIPMKKQKIYSISVLSGACCNLILDLVLIPFWGAWGASVGTIAAETTVTAIQLYFVNKILDIHILKVFFKSWKCFVSAILMAMFGLFLNMVLPQSVLCLAVLVVLSAVFYFIMLLLMKDRELYPFIDALKGRKKR
ncbi:MAG: flippase [Massilioclostridium sp.]|nr:MAG: flippase [Massilioclostridium sp.]